MRVSITLLISTFVISAYAAGTPPPPFVNARPPSPPRDICRCDDGSNRYDQVAGEWTQMCCMQQHGSLMTKSGVQVCQHFKDKKALGDFKTCCQSAAQTNTEYRDFEALCQVMMSVKLFWRGVVLTTSENTTNHMRLGLCRLWRLWFGDHLRATASSAELASVIVQISEAAVRPALSVVNMVSACDQVTHVAPTSLAHRARYAVVEGAILKAAIAVTTVATVVLEATVERTGGSYTGCFRYALELAL
ncbi:hypothetical protein BDV30DRAFT_229023 [Aspergillus minisclerotigenes]|uniref:Extracellular membrane protein CFEM domain-containing protein n=1 Tax=Aspergillus minisclerotigenes TaxID=656917 RepID=A0A5N6IWS1_9EURO|nr:hypothetical protein BDV30DRAFT_229023 [Aspergillus minisclerotigenes]